MNRAVDDPEPKEPPPPEHRPFRRRLLINTLASGVSNAWAIVLALVTLPLVLHGLGTRTFGIWVILQTFSASTGWLAILDGGLGTSATRQIARHSSVEATVDTGAAIGTSLVAFAGLAVVGAGIAIAVGAPVVNALGRVPSAQRGTVEMAVLLLGGQVVAELAFQWAISCLEGLQRADLSRASDMVRRGLFAGTTSWAALATHSLVRVELAALVSSVVGALVGIVLLQRHARGVRPHWSRSEFRPLVHYGGIIALLRPISAMYRLMDRIIVAAALGPSAVTLVEIATQLQNGASAVLAAASYAVMPGAAWLHGRSGRTELKRLLLDGTRYVLLVSLPVAVGVIVLAGPGIDLWVGHRYHAAASATQIAVAALAVGAIAQVGSLILTGTGRAVVILRASAIGVVVNLGLSIALVFPLGIDGVFWATLISFLITTPWIVVSVCRDSDVAPAEFLRTSVLPTAVPLAAEGVACAAVVLLGLRPLGTVILGGACGAVAYSLTALKFSFAPGEIKDLRRGLKRQ